MIVRLAAADQSRSGQPSYLALALAKHDDALLAFCKRHHIQMQAWGAIGAGTWGPSILSNPILVEAAKAHNVSTAQVACA